MKTLLQKIMCLIAGTVLLITSAGCKKPSPPPVPKVLKVAVNEIPPYSSCESGQMDGIDIAILNDIAGKHGYTLSITMMPLAGLFDSIDGEHFEIGAGGLSISEERKRKVDYTIPYDRMPIVFISSKRSPLKSVDDLKSKTFTIGVYGGTTQGIYNRLKGQEVCNFDSFGTAITAILCGNIDGMLCDRCVFETYSAVNPELVIFPEVIPVNEYAFCVAKNKPEILKMLNEELDAMKKSGRFDEIRRKFYPVANIPRPNDVDH